MPEFFLELFSEEIPARMQRGAADDLARICTHELQYILPCQIKHNDEHKKSVRQFYGPRRIAIELELYDDDAPGTGPFAPERRDDGAEIRGPRIDAPEAALQGFLKKHSAEKGQLTKELGHYILRREPKVSSARELVMTELLPQIAKLGWPKSMRWGQSGDFTWVRPLRRVVCLLDGEVIPFKLGPVTASNETEGHRFLAPGAFTISSAADWEDKLNKRFVIADQTKRLQMIADGIAEKAGELGLNVVDDPGLIDEVNGLVEWPVPLIGKIDEDFMDLPPEVRELSMKVNQRYFALREYAGRPAPYFAFVSNVRGRNDVSAIVSGNERVLRARLADARHFWDLDLKMPFSHYLDKLKNITFHAQLGTQGKRADEIASLASRIAGILNGTLADIEVATNAGALAKADLATGMVGEFPELQGIIGGYYAEKLPHGWGGAALSEAIRTHYLPKGPGDAVPHGIVPCSVALADKLNTLFKFFGIDEKPTGSGDPYALRRAALGIIRIILENELSSLDLNVLCLDHEGVLDFIFERLRVKLRAEGKRSDVLDAVFAVSADGNLVRLMKRVDALTSFLSSEDGTNLLIAYRRAANILRIEEAKTGAIHGPPNPMLFEVPEERRLADFLNDLVAGLTQDILNEDFSGMMDKMSQLRAPVDAFFEKVTVNTNSPNLTLNRFKILAQLRSTMHAVADFSKIEG
jgi:glycyl-tRNA synthetase beta chain